MYVYPLIILMIQAINPIPAIPSAMFPGIVPINNGHSVSTIANLIPAKMVVIISGIYLPPFFLFTP